nr:hypothetical protein [Klebsiella oxytoca]
MAVFIPLTVVPVHYAALADTAKVMPTATLYGPVNTVLVRNQNVKLRI